ncbi:putative baseplate assembly protein [Poseidonocella sedimentorum]|uniref:Putative baseplate assembly protein n=1 Tax=Poseidonocella sedimentorum TaxID=871652 RepID=A0A1I6DPD9_9RHOB|nr:putative baseplate assembly protein [Poseidonocella sedimentorum]SFR07295.1 putative baseplate assembly protein [Poseidonocella sedimentorum]
MRETHSLCDACDGITVSTPRASWQRPGLSAIDARAGDYWAYYETLTARLSSAEYGPLADLKTRDPGRDFSIALLDAWAVSGEVLSFYANRLTSETLLDTAGELWSLHQLAALVGYRPNPGAAAETTLAFTMSTTPGAPQSTTLPSGIKVQSTPGPDESPVIFETTEAIPARPAWNAMRPQQGAVQTLTAATRTLYLSGLSTGLVPGDALVFFAEDGAPVLALIRAVVLEPADIAADPGAVDLTRLEIDPLATDPGEQAATAPPAPTAPVLPPVLAAQLGQTLSAGALTELLEAEALSEAALFDPLRGLAETPPRILVFREAAGAFGNAAPAFDTLPPSLTGDVPRYNSDSAGNVFIDGFDPAPYHDASAAEWADASLTVLEDGDGAVYLDRVIKEIGAGGYAVLRDGASWGVYGIEDTGEVSLSEFAITGKVTRLTLHSAAGFGSFSTRGTTIHAGSEWIDLPRSPLRTPLRAGETQLALDTWAPGLQNGQKIFLRGQFADGLAAPITRLVEIAGVEHQIRAGGTTELTLSAPLREDFDRTALRINANVAAANHGETTEEILGGGDPGQRFQSFTLRQKPLTHVSADVAGGVRPELTLRVNGVRWDRVPDFLDPQPNLRGFTLTTDPEGVATVGFGNPDFAASPAKGAETISVSYRTGLGLEGRVEAGQLNILMTRPLGLDGVENPLATEGGADPASAEALRSELPMSLRTLGRVVSLSDFEDYSRSYAGIAKARAEWVRLPGAIKPGVVVTVAGEEAAELPPETTLHTTLRDALTADGLPFARFRLRSFRPRYFRLAAKVKPHPDYIADDVLAAVEAALRAAYAFEARAFSAPVFASEVITVMQGVAGVEAVTLDRLYRGAAAQRREVLHADSAGPAQGAELLMLHPEPLDYLEVLS